MLKYFLLSNNDFFVTFSGLIILFDVAKEIIGNRISVQLLSERQL